ncbi:unnamed protein product [Pieris brassicae]|uniref:Uncharacterized protein n=1 Tax=Pieris brassicae TaxID=7116 RepID=A0A9P0TRC2_PIEBR|nr:unnamed protein product [Pieris brassicae]
MYELKACSVCLSTGVKFVNIDSGQLRHEYNLISGLKTNSESGLPHHLCIECATFIKKFMMFRNKCQRAYYTLLEILNTNCEITEQVLKALNKPRLKINPALSYLASNNPRVKYEVVKFKWLKESRVPLECNKIQTLHYSTLYDEAPPEHMETKITEVSETNAFNNLVDETVSDDDYFNDNSHNNDDVDGSNLEEDFAVVMPISRKEAEAVGEIYKMLSQGKFQCKVCGNSYYTEARLKVHMRMHDTSLSGKYFCELCSFYYKTSFQLKTHISGKHTYKYLCKQCPEVSFDRTSAKSHYIWNHLKDIPKSKLGKRKAKNYSHSAQKRKKLPSDFPLCLPVSQEDQYRLVKERQQSKNYIESPFKCELCYKGFREPATYDKHMKKHDPAISGQYQCDVCKVYVKNTRQIYKHMARSHIHKYSCQECPFTCFCRGQAKMHYRWHKNVTYSCPHCNKEFVKASTRLTHIRIKHPSTFVCTICGHSFVSESGLYCHKKIAHTKEEMDASSKLETDIETTSSLYCAECQLQFQSEAAFVTHFGSSNKHASTNLSIKPSRGEETLVNGKATTRPRGRPRRDVSEVLNNGTSTAGNCDICKKYLSNDVQARKHYESEHPGAEYLKRYMCDICGHTTKQYANLMVHMRTHTREKPYACPYCDRRFSMVSNRDRHIVVHTGEKRYECQHCGRRFTQSSAVKLHIQTVHLKIPYAPWDKKNRKRRKEMETSLASVAQPKAPDTQGEYINAYMFNL